MVTVQRAVTVAAGVLAPGHLGELTGYVPFELADDVLEQTLTAERRTRLLPSRVGIYFVLALALFPGLGYLRVRDKLTAALDGLGLARPTEKALRDLRLRLGAAPLRLLFECLAGPVALPGTPGVRYRRWRTVAFDGCSSVKVPDRPRVCAWLGKIRHRYGEDGYPVLRVMALCETGTRALIGAVFGPAADGEISYAARLLHLLDDSMLLLDDRGFDSGEFLAAIAAARAQMLVRLNSHRAPARWALLPDGTYLTVINGVRLRIIDAQVTVTASGGLQLGGRYRLAATLLDHRRYPAAELTALYHERWEIELAFYSLRCTLQQGLVLRSQDPVSVQQETWAQLAVDAGTCRRRPGTRSHGRAAARPAAAACAASTSTVTITAAPYRRRDHRSAGSSTCVRPQARHRDRRGRNSSQPPGIATRRRRARPHGPSTPPHGHRSTPAASRDSTLSTEPRTVTTRCHLRHQPGGLPRSHCQEITGRAAAITDIATVTPSINPRPANPPDNPERHGQRHPPRRRGHSQRRGTLGCWAKEGILTKTAPATFALHADWATPDNPAHHQPLDTQTSPLTTRPCTRTGRLRNRHKALVSPTSPGWRCRLTYRDSFAT